MPTLSPKTSAVSILWAVALYFGICLFLLSFSLPAVGNLTGLECAEFAIKSWRHDDKISSLALFGGWLNPQVLLLFFLSVFRVVSPLRAALTVTILFSIPMTWIAIHRMNAAGTYMDFKVGHFLWIARFFLSSSQICRCYSFSLSPDGLSAAQWRSSPSSRFRFSSVSPCIPPVRRTIFFMSSHGR